ncbi:MAG: aminotransferase class V-fold PLP-dependent enzyme [Epsilonproteobacteria bacterium]|nr:aminotransferase class V-fold PLP-dependent enzyme [Campylobacterota bacterium]
MVNRIFLSPPHMSGQEQKYIDEVFKSNYIAPLGAYVTKFEEMITAHTGASYALATSSATAALHLALRVLGIGKDDLVLASSFTFIGSVAPILYQNAQPVFIDSDSSWNLSTELLTKAIDELPVKPKALILTHLYGQMAEIDEIVSICKAHGIFLIEDAAESLGASFKRQESGTFGDLGVFSFNGNKILTTSGGGMLVSENESWIKKAEFLATQAREEALFYQHEEVGYNYRMSNVLAAIGVAQMEVLVQRVAKKREIFSWYQEELSALEEITFMPEVAQSIGNRWLTTLTFAKTDPFSVIKALEKENIESRPLWKPMHLQPLFKESLTFLNGMSEKLFHSGICLPSGTAMCRSEVQKVSTILKEML